MAGSSLMLAPDAHSGRRLGKYEILCRLSTGGMSEIFLAFQKGLAGFRKFIVLKQILPDIKGEEEFVRMFLDEAKITAAFTHPNIAQVFDLDIDDGELFLAMEFVPGATLVEVARACRQLNEPIPVGFTLMSVRDTALALHYAHTFTDPMGRPQQVIHRDIAEKNIMVTYEGVTKLLDFGIAKALNRVSRTSVGMVKGTSGYMSPEQILGEPLDPRSDIFALGVVAHECLTGMRLFHGKTAEDGMMQALKGEVQPPSRLNPTVSQELDAVVLKALQRKREDRYATALEMARAVERASAGELWHPEQSAEFIQRLFAERRDQTRVLMSQANDAAETTGEFKLAKLLGNEPPPSPPPPAIKTSGAALPKPAPASLRSSSAAISRPPPPPPEALQPPPQPAPSQPPPSPPRQRERERERPSGARPAPEPITAPRTPTRERERRAARPPPPVPDVPFPVNDVEEPEARTIPGSSLEELIEAEEKKKRASATTSPARKPLPRREPPTPPRRPARPRPDPDEDDDTASETLARADVTSPGVRMPTDPEVKRGRPALMVALGLVLLALLGGTVFALGLHEEFLAGGGSGTASAEIPAPGALEPIAMAPVPAAEAKPPEVTNEPSEAAGQPAPAEADDSAPAAPVAAAPNDAVPAAPAKGSSGGNASRETVAAPVAEAPKPKRKRVASSTPKKAVAESNAPEGESSQDEAGDDSAADAWAAAAEAKKEKTGTGMLTLVTEPFSTVYMGGKSLGETPLVKLPVTTGKYTLKLVGPDGKAVALPVQITDGEETKVRVPLSTLKPL